MIVILHHAGDANDPPVRVASTVRLADQLPSCKVYVLADTPDGEALFGQLPLCALGAPLYGATDTVGEVRATLRWVRPGDTLYISTEPGHLGRAVMIARILYWRRGVRIIPWPSAPGTYRSPWLRTVRDCVRAVWWRVVG